MWDQKYRPLKFADVLGQDGNIKVLKARLRKGTAFDTSYVFSGGFGRGKTTLSRIHARAMLCLDLDKTDPEPCNACENCTSILNEQPGAFSERDAASQGTIDHMRAIVEELPFVIPNAPKRIYLFDEAHRMGSGSQDVLLKPLEEKRMVGMFCTTEVAKLRPAIRSRSEEYTIRTVTRDDVLKRMRMVLAAEAVEFEDDAVYIVIDHANGHVRDVLNMLEMISQLGPVTVANVRDYLRLSVVTLYYEILLNLDNPTKAIELLDQACDHVAPEDISSGLAEAAMNSFRISHNMHANFALVDKKLAEQVYGKYQASVIRLADWFLRSRFATKLSLTRDLVILSQTPGNLPADGPAPPVVFASATAPQQAPLVATTMPSVSAPTNGTSTKSLPPTPEHIDYSDPTIPSELEKHVVNSPLPRSRGQHGLNLTRGSGRGHKTMTPLEWRTSFEQLYRKKLHPALPK